MRLHLHAARRSEDSPERSSFSARHQGGINYAVLNPNVLSNPRQQSQLTYRLHGQSITVEEKPGVPCMEITIDAF